MTTYRIRYTLAGGEVRLSFPFGEHETADRWAMTLRACPDVIRAEAVRCPAEAEPTPAA